MANEFDHLRGPVISGAAGQAAGMFAARTRLEQREKQQQQKAIDAYRLTGQQAAGDPNTHARLLTEAGYPDLANKVRTEAATMQGQQTKNYASAIDYLRDKSSIVGDQASWSGFKSSMEQMGVVNPGELPEEYGPDVQQLLQRMQASGRSGQQTPADIQEHKYYLDLGIDRPGEPKGSGAQRQREYLNRKRAGKIIDVGSGFQSVDPLDPSKTTPVAPRQLKPSEQPDYLRTAEESKGAGKATAEGAASLESTISDIEQYRNSVRGLLSHKGFPVIYGRSRYLDPRNLDPASDAAAAQAMLTQLDAASFGIAIQKMRGLGQLSDAEGRKVSAAFTRATNPRQPDEEAKKAWDEVLQYLDLAEKRAYRKAGKQPAQSAPAAPNVPQPAATQAQPQQRTAPPVNQRGWKLHIDASGNQAYVGPNGEIEEVQ